MLLPQPSPAKILRWHPVKRELTAEFLGQPVLPAASQRVTP